MGGYAMAMVRKAGWFVVVAVMMAGWMGVLGSVRGVAEAGVIASNLSDAGSRVEEMAKVQSFLENKVVVQKLVDYGVSPAEAMAKVKAMSAQDLHRLASLTDRAAAGTDSGLEILIFLAILVILIIVIFKLMNKEVVIR
ncbi:MAG: PA2779 family protein [Candidatus Deferrimicrobium sp.]|nr:PA2779 family protein [Candidatus Deferrimicrobium sp.]